MYLWIHGCPSMHQSGLSSWLLCVPLYDIHSFLVHCLHCSGWKIFLHTLSVSRGKHLRQTDPLTKEFRLKTKILWNSSMTLKDFCSRRHPNSHTFVFPILFGICDSWYEYCASIFVFADSNICPWNLTTSFTWRAARSAILFVSERWSVDVWWFHDKMCQIPMTCPYKKLSASVTALLRYLRFFVFTRIRLYPLSGEILYHDSVSVIVSRFRSLI